VSIIDRLEGDGFHLRRFVFTLSILMIAAIMFAACSTRSASDDAGDDSTVAVTETPVDAIDDAEATPEAADDAADDQEADDDPVRRLEELERDTPIAPEEFYMISSAGQQTGWPRTYFWSDPEEIVAIEMQGYYVPLHDEPLVVEPGETLSFEWERDDIDPESISIRVYPREENFEEDVATRDGDSDAFAPNTDPLTTEEIDAVDAEWTVDLEEGEYFLLVDTGWPTPEGWPREREAQFAFWIIVE
jgi:hypothetical protein